MGTIMRLTVDGSGNVGRNTGRFGAPNPPPGGFAGVAQQTPATQVATYAPFMRSSNAGGRKTSSRKRARSTSRAAASVARRKRPSKRRSGMKRGRKRAHLVKGSLAAKRYMAKIRRKRRK